jgi:hypothetical protein
MSTDKAKSSVNSRRKGHAFENSICKLIHLELGISVSRNIEQTRDGGCDIELADLFAIECKRYASNAGGWFQPDWWKQAERSATLCNMIPCLIWKYDRQPIRMALPIYSINSDYAMDSSQYDWPREGNACKPLVMDIETGFMIMREGL